MAVSLNESIEKVLQVLSAQFERQGIRVVRKLGALPRVKADSFQIEQVLNNLFINALYALRADPEGKIIVETRCEGDFVTTRIIDNGEEIPEQLLPMIFDPFFTTKPVGEGVGLGLSICSGIIRDHGGTIRAESDRGTGTVFSFTLPVAADGELTRRMREIECPNC
jgi:signal transduction histidine kinase